MVHGADNGHEGHQSQQMPRLRAPMREEQERRRGCHLQRVGRTAGVGDRQDRTERNRAGHQEGNGARRADAPQERVERAGSDCREHRRKCANIACPGCDGKGVHQRSQRAGRRKPSWDRGMEEGSGDLEPGWLGCKDTIVHPWIGCGAPMRHTRQRDDGHDQNGVDHALP